LNLRVPLALEDDVAVGLDDWNAFSQAEAVRLECVDESFRTGHHVRLSILVDNVSNLDNASGHLSARNRRTGSDEVTFLDGGVFREVLGIEELHETSHPVTVGTEDQRSISGRHGGSDVENHVVEWLRQRRNGKPLGGVVGILLFQPRIQTEVDLGRGELPFLSAVAEAVTQAVTEGCRFLGERGVAHGQKEQRGRETHGCREDS